MNKFKNFRKGSNLLIEDCLKSYAKIIASEDFGDDQKSILKTCALMGIYPEGIANPDYSSVEMAQALRKVIDEENWGI